VEHLRAVGRRQQSMTVVRSRSLTLTKSQRQAASTRGESAGLAGSGAMVASTKS
jgi:hypothetical protein